MDTARLRELRAGRRVSLKTLGGVIGKSVVSYGKKERGRSASGLMKLWRYLISMVLHMTG